jgi:hypothetical protein
MQVEEELVEIPIDECDATKHPKKGNACILERCPFHAPQTC